MATPAIPTQDQTTGVQSWSLVGALLWVLNVLTATIFGTAATRAILATLPGPQSWQSQAIYVTEVAASYRWVAADVTSADGWTVIAPTGGVAGRWFLTGPWLTLAPNGATDGTVISAALAALSASVARRGSAGALCLTTGTYVLDVPITLASNVDLYLTAQTTLSSLVASPDSPISAFPGGGPVASTTLSANVKVGDTQVSTVGAIPATWVDPNGVTQPTTIVLSDATPNQGQAFEVKSVTGSGPYTVTLSSPTVYAVTAASSNVQTINPVKNVSVYGNGGLLTGTGGNGIELSKVLNVWVYDLRIAGTMTQIGASFDIASRYSGFVNLDVDGRGICGICVSFESTNGCEMRSSRLRNATGQNLWMTQAVYSLVDHCDMTSGGTHGAQIEGVGTGSVISATSFRNNASRGAFFGSASGYKMVGCAAANNGNAGVESDSLSTDLTIDDLATVDNTNAGLRILGGTVRVSNLSSQWSGVAGRSEGNALDIGGTARVMVDVLTSSNNFNGIYTHGAATLEVANFDLSAPATTWNGVQLGSGGSGAQVALTNGTIRLGTFAGGSAIQAFDATICRLTNVQSTGTGGAGGTGLKSTGVASVWAIGPGCDFGSATTPNALDASAVVTMAQPGGVAAVSATASLTFAQNTRAAIELASGAGADSTITTYSFPGLQYTARNLTGARNLLLKTASATAITVAAGKTAIVAVNAAGDMARVTADT